MATASHVELAVGHSPAFSLPGITPEQAKKASELLQENHEQHHIFFNQNGFHNHIAHHLLTAYALATDPKDLQRHYDANKGYQRSQAPLDHAVVEALANPDGFAQHLGQERYYHEFLVFFQQQIEASRWQDVINTYLLARDERADDLLARLFGGFVHPLIHLGFGVEFAQPAIIAEALAQAAVHSNWMKDLLFPAERAAAADRDAKPSKPIVQLLDEIHADAALSAAPRWSDGNKLRDGTLGRAGDSMVRHAAQFRVDDPAELDAKTAEMTNAVAYYTAGAQRRDKRVMWDFYYMHCVNSSIFFAAFMRQGAWLRDADRVRLLEFKVRTDLAMYASRRSPPILLDEIQDYAPRHPSGWDDVFARVRRFEDDGHASKLVRALAHGQRISAPYQHEPRFRIKDDDWLRMAHMAIDSVEVSDPNWVRSAGFDEAWEQIPERAQL